ncbi:hypothetical protein KAR91_53745 [Candidatus Pacearchaeota archaeon]|nr:hypothetical protein [Candidatus Pacearchaeota archaeon]
MIKEITAMQKKYEQYLKQNTEYVSIGQVVNDLRQLAMDARLKRIPKDER